MTKIASFAFLLLICPLIVSIGFGQVITIAEARAQVAQGRAKGAVTVRGQVTFSSQRLGLAFIQDESAGIGFDPRTGSSPLPKPGEQVEIRGMLTRRQGVLMVLRDPTHFGAPKVTFLPEKKPWVQPLRFDLDDAAQMRIDGLLTKVAGVIRRVSIPPQADAPMLVEISSASGHAIARLPWRESPEVLESWLNAPVTLNGVLISQAEPPMLASDAHALLLVALKSEWNVQPELMEAVFARPPVTAATAIQVTPRTTVKQRLHLMGTVTAAKPRQWVCLRTDEGSVEVSTRQMAHFQPGEKLSVACWPHNRNGQLVLKDAVCRSLGMGPPPQPIKLTSDFHTQTHAMDLVEVTGILQKHAIPESNPRLVLMLPNGHQCLLMWSTFMDKQQVASLMDSSTLRLTGLFYPTRNLEGEMETSSFAVMPRSMADLKMIKQPSWWTLARLQWAVWWLLGITGIALPVAVLFRWQLWRQSQHIREIESRSATEEERRRIAREFHDSLQQQLASAALHLETVKGALKAAPEMLPRLIDDTTAMLRHCQLEARHCIWDLRSEVSTRESLAESIRTWLKARQEDPESAKIEFRTEGDMPLLSEGVPFHLMRITQEAVNNALTHAEASKIQVSLKSCHHGLDLTIEDDGRGFDTRLLRDPKPGHYGLSSLCERAAKIGARLDLRSHQGQGTRVTLRVPYSSPSYERPL